MLRSQSSSSPEISTGPKKARLSSVAAANPHISFCNNNNKSVSHLSHLFHLPCLWHFVLSAPDSSRWCSLPLCAQLPHARSSSSNGDRTVSPACVWLGSWCWARGCPMRSDRPSLRLRQSPGSLWYQESSPRWCQSGGRRGFQLSGRGGWGRKIERASSGSSAGSSGEAWPWPMPVMTSHKWGESKRDLALHWMHKKTTKISPKQPSLTLTCVSQKEEDLHGCCCCSVHMAARAHSHWQSNPRGWLWGHSVKGERLRMKDDRSTLLSLHLSAFTEMSHQHCSGTFSHAARKEESFIYQLNWNPSAFL